ncbi:MAG: roadblock/LC7 domain-containing protein [Candidatus Thorarchaeota archaeon]
MSSRIVELSMVLRELDQRCGLFGSALVNEKGQLMSSSLPQGVDERAISAMAASMLSISRRVSEELGCGEPQSIVLEGQRKLIVMTLVNNLVLVGMARVDAEVSLIGFEMDEAAARVRLVLGA